MLFGKKKIEKQRRAQQRINRLSEEIAEIWNGPEAPDNFDVDGSYTGTADNNEAPVQDADDL